MIQCQQAAIGADLRESVTVEITILCDSNPQRLLEFSSNMILLSERRAEQMRPLIEAPL